MSARKEGKSELGAALKEAQRTPHREDLWNRLEEIAAAQQRPDEVAELYRRVVREGDRPELLAVVAPRAVRFHEEWYGAAAEGLSEILGRVLEVDPGSEWALRRLSVLFTRQERWSDLLTVYDRSLAAVEDVGQRRELLAEAVRIAKDFLGDPDRTIQYLAALLQLSPGESHLAGQLERLLERQGRWEELAGLWRSRAANLSGGEARQHRVKVANLLLERGSDPARALEELAPALSDGSADDATVALADRILRLPTARPEVRSRALGLLRTRHEKTGRGAEVMPVLEAGLEFAAPAERMTLHRELAERLASSGDRRAAMEQLLAVLGLGSTEAEVLERLRHLSETQGDPQPYLRGLEAVAGATADAQQRIELLSEAAAVHEQVGDTRRALEVYRRIFRDGDAQPPARLEAARKLLARLEELPDAEETPGERLAVLESLAGELPAAGAGATPGPAAPGALAGSGVDERRGALIEAAGLAEARGELERAAGLLGRMLESDPSDRLALDALVGLHERNRQWEQLVSTLWRRQASARSAPERRADLVRIARLQAAEIAQPTAAIDTWREIERLYGEDQESALAKGELLAVSERWGELAEHLTRTGERDSARLGDLFARLGDAYRERLADPRKAVSAYARALELDPTHARAVSGARALVGVESCRGAAAEALARAYQATGDWRSLIDLLEVRLLGATDDAARSRLLVEGAALYERKGEEPTAALALLARALPLTPDDGALERELARLGAGTRSWNLVVEALRGAAAATRDPLRAARLRLQEGQLRELELGDPQSALEPYREALERDPGRAELREAVVRAAARNGNWVVAAEAALAPGLAREALERTFLPLLEGLAAEAGAYSQLAAAAAAVLDAPVGDRVLDPALTRDLEVRVARYFELGGGADAAERQEVALARAAALSRAVRGNAAIVGGRGLATGELYILQRLAELQRRTPGRALCETLLAESELNPTDLDSLREAAAVALRDGGGRDSEPLLRPILQRLYEHSVRLLRAGQSASGRLPAEEGAAFAAEELGRLELGRPERSAAVRALELTLDATRLPIGKEHVRRLRARAADVALEKLRDRKTAIGLLRQLTEDTPDDMEALGKLATLYAEEKRLPELLALRADELARTQKVDRRLSLRLEMDRIAAALEERSTRLDMLRANLEEQPGHRPTIETLARMLEAKGRHGELVEVLNDQATRLEERGDRETAARLWDWSAQILENPLADRDRAIRAYERVAELGARPETFESLGRLHLDRGEPLLAAGWLERWLDVAQGPARTRAALELAGAYLTGDKRQRAVATLERALGEDPKANEVRTRLVDLYRRGESWEPLVRTLNDGTAFISDSEAIVASAREASEVAAGRLSTPQLALGALERAVALVPGDKELRSRFADALAAAGELPRSREILEELIKEIGRRRSRERALLHERLARVARREGKLPEALSHLEQAADMDMDNVLVLEALAEVAEQNGDSERAERAYRALVLAGRREGQPIGTLTLTDALLRLRAIARARGQEDKAQDLLDSAVAEVIARPQEAPRLGQALKAEGSTDLLRGAIDRRLGAASDPVQQAAILAERAELQEAEGQRAEALDSLLAAVDKAPSASAIRVAARGLASRAGDNGRSSARLADALAALAEQKRRSAEAPLHAGLLAEAGQVALEDLQDFQRASDLWGRALQVGAEGGPAVVEAAFSLHALAASAPALTSTAADRQKALKTLQRLGRADTPGPLRIEALYRLAEAQLGREETREPALAALASALELSGDVERAFSLVRRANVPDSELPRVLPLYERVARGSKDDRMLLDFLERRAALPSATVAEVKEGVELALALNELSRAEVLLRRAVELARSGIGGEPDRKLLEWSLLELAEVRRSNGDIAGAVVCLEEARDIADPARVLRLYQDIARKALETGGDPAVAARVYERLWERDPTDRRTWEPLLSLHSQLGDAASVERVATGTIERLFDAHERNSVRLARARYLASVDRRDPALVETLRAVLADEPTQQEAIEMLADVYQATGNEEGLTELLRREIDSAAGRRDVPTVVSLSVRLGQRLLASGAPGDARDVYRRGLETAPNDVGLLRALLGLLTPEDGPERAGVLERLLENESGEAAASLSVELAALWESLGDEERVRRALEVGVARAAGTGGVFERLAEFYRIRHAWDRLAALMVSEAERRKAPAEQAALLKEAAEIHRNMLAKPAEATELLRRARRLAPEDPGLLSDLVAALDAVGERGQAIEELGRALGELPPRSPQRIMLLETRAELYERAGEHEGAVEDREQAFSAGGDQLEPPLREALVRWKTHASERGDAAGERKAVRRLFDLLTRYEDESAGRSVLAEWCNRHPEDAESLRLLAARDQAAERWEAVVESAFRLVEVETGNAQVAAAELLVNACERIGQLAPAIAGLEAALRAQPDNRWLYDALMNLYERGGDRRRQAALLLWAGERSPDPEIQYTSLRQAGEIFLRDRDLDNATAAFQRAITLKPADRELSLLVAEVYIAAGKLAEAEGILDSLMKRAAKDLTSIELSSLQHRMAQLAEARGDQNGRLDWLRRAFDTNRKNAPVAIELADLAESVNDVDLAVKALRAVTLLPPASAKLTPAMAFLRQARIAQRTGDRPRAVIFAKRALQEDPRLSDAVEFLRDLGERRV